MEKEVRDAIKRLKGNLSRRLTYSERDKDTEVLLTLAEQYLSVKLPEEEKESDMCQCEFSSEYINEKENLIKCKDCEKQVGNKTWNVCLCLCKLSMVKAVPSVSEIQQIVCMYLLDEGKPRNDGSVPKLATALHQMFLGRIGGING